MVLRVLLVLKVTKVMLVLPVWWDYLDNVVNLVWPEKKVNVVLKAPSVPKAQLANKENEVFKESWDHLDLRVSPPSVVILDLLDLRVKLALLV